jgi:hypothetical protein
MMSREQFGRSRVEICPQAQRLNEIRNISYSTKHRCTWLHTGGMVVFEVLQTKLRTFYFRFQEICEGTHTALWAKT